MVGTFPSQRGGFWRGSWRGHGQPARAELPCGASPAQASRPRPASLNSSPGTLCSRARTQRPLTQPPEAPAPGRSSQAPSSGPSRLPPAAGEGLRLRLLVSCRGGGAVFVMNPLPGLSGKGRRSAPPRPARTSSRTSSQRPAAARACGLEGSEGVAQAPPEKGLPLRLRKGFTRWAQPKPAPAARSLRPQVGDRPGAGRGRLCAGGGG